MRAPLQHGDLMHRQHTAQPVPIRYTNQKLAKQEFTDRKNAAGAGAFGERIRPKPRSFGVCDDVRCRRNDGAMQDGRGGWYNLHGYLPADSPIRICRQFHGNPEPLSGTCDTIRLGELHVPNESRAEFSGSSIPVWRDLSAECRGRCGGHFCSGEPGRDEHFRGLRGSGGDHGKTNQS